MVRITKFGHCCLLIEKEGVRVLTDPGNYVTLPAIERIDAILITHEHADHIHIEQIQSIMECNPDVQIYTHEGVGRLLREAGISFTSVQEGETIHIRALSITRIGSEHACIHPDLPSVENAGFVIGETVFFPGDAFVDLQCTIDILALPVAGPWMKLSEAIEYAKQLRPKVVFPVHDGMLRQGIELLPTRRIPASLLAPLGIEYRDMIEGSVEEFV